MYQENRPYASSNRKLINTNFGYLMLSTNDKKLVLLSLSFILSLIIYARIAFTQDAMAAIDCSSLTLHPVPGCSKADQLNPGLV